MDWPYAIFGLGLVAILSVVYLVRASKAANERKEKERLEKERKESIKAAIMAKNDYAVKQGVEAARQAKGESACPYPSRGNDPGNAAIYPGINVPVDFDDQHFWWIVAYRETIEKQRGPGQRQELDRARKEEANIRAEGPAHLKPFVTRLRAIYADKHSLSSSEARKIGQEIFERHGQDAMVTVCDVIRVQLGNGPYRQLEFNWDGIGDWQM